MDTCIVSPRRSPIDFISARKLAISEAGERIPDPVIIAWKDDHTGRFGPDIPGAKGYRWHDYGENFGGQLECDVSNKYHFIFVDGSQFENNIIKRVSYGDIKMISSTAAHVMFKTFETVESVDGSVNSQGIEVLLEKEGDGQWRLIQERILPIAETKHDGLLN